MNIFRKAVMKNIGEFKAEQADEEEQRKDEIDGLELIKGDWITWLEDCSEKKHKVPADTVSIRDTMRVVQNSEPCDGHEAGSSRTVVFQSTRKPREMSSLKNIIGNFEKGYLSPARTERTADEYKQKNFVKKIVEAFEMKYKIYNDSKTAQEIPKSPEGNKSNALMLESWKRRSRIFCNPFKNDSLSSKRNSTNADECDGSVLSSEEGIFHTSLDNNRLTRRRLREFENSECSVKSKMILSAFRRRTSGLELYSTFLRSNSDSSSSSNCITRAELIRKIDLSDLVKKFTPDNTKTKTKTKTKTMGSADPRVIPPEETTFTPDDSLPTTSTSNKSPKSDNSVLPEISHIDESPKVVGAFLKKPIDVENTFIDWIPITGKKLPRKRSLRKLLCSFTNGKLMKKFSSERDLSEEPRECQESGYDERSCSSMSLTSLISVADVLRHQESNSFESNKRSDLKTFKSKNNSNEEKGEAFSDTYHSVENQKGKQLLLTEVPREDVKLDLGPSYPPPSQTIRFLSPLVDKLVPSRLPEHPCVSKITKNSFVALTKMDNLAEFNSSHACYNSNGSSSTIIKNDLYEVEFRRSCSDLPSSNVYSSSSSVTSHYDVPRRFSSKSENEILRMWQSKSKLKRKEEPIYDVPKLQSIGRPRSSIYDDALSLKKKSIYEEAKTDLTSRSLAQRDLESHRAIAKPIDTRNPPEHPGAIVIVERPDFRHLI